MSPDLSPPPPTPEPSDPGQPADSGDGPGGDGGSGLPPARNPGLSPRRGRPRREYSAGGVVLRRIDGVVHVLLIRDPYQNWGLPKGHVEDGEDAREAAVREVQEETGLEDLHLGPRLDSIDWFFRLDGRLVHKFCVFYIMISTAGRVVPETAEGITACVWVPASEAPGRVTYDNAREVVQEALRRLGQADLPL